MLHPDLLRATQRAQEKAGRKAQIDDRPDSGVADPRAARRGVARGGAGRGTLFGGRKTTNVRRGSLEYDWDDRDGDAQIPLFLRQDDEQRNISPWLKMGPTFAFIHACKEMIDKWRGPGQDATKRLHTILKVLVARKRFLKRLDNEGLKPAQIIWTALPVFLELKMPAQFLK